MKNLAFKGIYFLALTVLVVLFALAGSYVLAEYWGKAGEIIGTIITCVAVFVPFGYTDEQHPYDKNLKIAIIALFLTYAAFAVFYGLGLLGNMVLGINTSGVITALLGLGLLTAFNVVFVLLCMLIRKINNRKLTTK